MNEDSALNFLIRHKVFKDTTNCSVRASVLNISSSNIKLVSAVKQLHRPVHVMAASYQKIQDAPMPHRIEKTLNEVTLLGRVGGEPQKRGSEQHPVVIFSLATHTNYRDESGDFSQKTDWHRICVFKPSLRDTVYNYMHKGQRVYVTGRLTYGEIKDEAGNARSATSIIAEDVIFFQANE